MSERVDFSANAGIYDQRHGASVPAETLSRLCAAAGIQAGARVLDIGAGTGRLAIPFAAHGCRVAAIEPARGMLAQLRMKDAGGRVATIAAEGSHLPCADRGFDAVVIARLLYLTPDWSRILGEACRVLAEGGALIHEWSNGDADEPWVRIREQARSLFEGAGVVAPFHPGVGSETEVDTRLAALGLECDACVEMGPGPEVTLREFLRRLVDGELSFIWNVPEAVRCDCLPQLRRWAEGTFDLDAPTPMPRRIAWRVYRRPAGATS